MPRPFTIFFCAALCLMAPNLFGPFSYFSVHDLAETYLVRFIAQADMTRHYGLSYWFPYQVAGVDSLVNGMRPFDINVLLFLLLPPWIALPVVRLVGLMMAGWFTFRLSREYLALTSSTAIVVGVVAQLLQLDLLETYLAWGAVPAIVFLILHLAAQRGLWTFAAVALGGLVYGFSVSLVWGLVYSIPIIWITVLVLCVFTTRGIRVFRAGILLLVFSVVAVVQHIDVIAATGLQLAESHRALFPSAVASEDVELGRYIDFDILSEWLPRILLLVLGIVALLSQSGNSRLAAGLILIASALISLMALGGWLQDILRTIAPALGSFNFGRFGQGLYLPLCLLGGLGLSSLLETGARRWAATLSIGLVLLAAIVPFARLGKQAKEWITLGSYTALFRSPDLSQLAVRMQRDPAFRVATVHGRMLHEGFSTGYGLESADGYLNSYPLAYNRFWARILAPLIKRHPLLSKRLTSSWSNRLRLMIDLTSAAPHQKLIVEDYYNLNLLALANVRYLISEIPLVSDRLKIITGTGPEGDWGSLTNVQKFRQRVRDNFMGTRTYIYELTDYLPRWYFVHRVERFADETKLLNWLSSSDLGTLRTTVAVTDGEAANGLMGASPELRSAVRVVAQEPSKLVLQLEADTSAVLVVTNSYSRFWVCRINNEKVPVWRAYSVFWAIPIPAGTHQLQCEYDPPYRVSLTQ